MKLKFAPPTNWKFPINKRKLCLITIIFISVLRVILCNKIQLRFRCQEYYDDQLLFNYAHSLLSGDWLGTYNNLTLTKGISYSVFIVLCNLLSIPYTTGLAFLNIGSAYTFVHAISPRFKNFYVKCILYVLLIFSPVGFSAYITQRTYRMAIVPYVVLLVISCFTAIYFRKKAPLKQWIPWALGAGISVSFFWHIREDSIWILPPLSVILILIIWYQVKQKYGLQKLMAKMTVLAIPFFMLGLTTLFISGMNYKHYGLFTVNDRSQTEFSNFMSNLYKIEDKKAPDYSWVSKAQLQAAIDASPTLASIKETLYTNHNAWGNGGEIRGDLIAWSIRNGVQDAGYYKDAVTTNDFYKQVNIELENAFRNQTITKDNSIHFTSQAKGIILSDIPGLLVKAVNTFYDIGKYDLTGLKSEPFALGDITDIRKCEVLFGNLAYYSPPDETSTFIDTQLLTGKDPVKASSRLPIRIGNFIAAIYTKLALPVNIIAALSYILVCVYLLLRSRQKKSTGYTDLWLTITGFGLSSFVLICGVVFFTSWFPPEQEPFVFYYSAGAYLLIQAAKYLSIYCVFSIGRKKLRKLPG